MCMENGKHGRPAPPSIGAARFLRLKRKNSQLQEIGLVLVQQLNGVLVLHPKALRQLAAIYARGFIAATQ